MTGIKFLLTFIIIVLIALVSNVSSAAPVYCSENGHYYEAILGANPITWNDARTAAEKLTLDINGIPVTGHLATVTSQSENDFILNNVISRQTFYWLGGFQPAGSEEPTGGWQWITGEPWSYTNWIPNREPNNLYSGGIYGLLKPVGSSEDALEIQDYNMWNDFPSDIIEPGFIVEYESKVTNNQPVAKVNGPYTGNEGSLITFDATGSSDPDNDPLVYEWDFNKDGEFDFSSSEPVATHKWEDDYTETILLKVTDDKGLYDTASTTVTINNIAPDVGEINSPVDPVQVGVPVKVSSTFTDSGILDTHTAVWKWMDSVISDGLVTENSGSGTVSGENIYSSAGVYKIILTVTDGDSGSDYSVSNYVVVYDPQGGFVTGGGWINSPAGAYAENKDLAGKASFGFVSKYQKGSTVPTGNTQFQFNVANLNFHSESYDWLVVAGSQAKFKGTGTINGEGNYGFMLSAIDGAIKGDNIDKFRIKIWDKGTNEVIYDNEIEAAEDAEPTTAIDGGSIIIHTGK